MTTREYGDLYQKLGQLMGEFPENPDESHPDYADIVALNDAYEKLLDAAAHLGSGEPLRVRPGRFSYDDETVYEGFTAGYSWNGFECPYFTREVAEKVVDDAIAVGEWDEEVIDELRRSLDAPTTTSCGKELYSIGGWSWVLQAVDEA